MHGRSYVSRDEAGKIIGNLVINQNLANPYILAIPRGGIQVAKGIADELKLPINIIVSKKLPIPGSPETGFGAITSDGTTVLDEETVINLKLTKQEIDEISNNIVNEIKHRDQIYGGFDHERIKFSDVIIVDDGIATGLSLMAAINSIKNYNPGSINVAVPVSSSVSAEKIKKMTDRFICPIIEEVYYFAVGNYYDDFSNLSENEIVKIIKDYKRKY